MLYNDTERYERHLYQHIMWVEAAMLDQYEIQGIQPGKMIHVTYRKFTSYCPRYVWEPVGLSLDYAACIVAEQSVWLAERRGVIGIARKYGPKGNLYWLPREHPAVQCGLGNSKLKLVHSTH